MSKRKIKYCKQFFKNCFIWLYNFFAVAATDKNLTGNWCHYRVSEPACFRAAPAPRTFFPEPAPAPEDIALLHIF